VSITYAAFERSIDNHYEFHPMAAEVDEFLGLSIKKRISAIRGLYLKHDTADIRTTVDNLLSYFDRCCFNRNQLLHAEFYPASFGGKPDTLYLIKRADKRSRKSVHMKFSLSQLRAIADQMRKGVVQSAEIHIYRRFEGIPVGKVPNAYRPYVVSGPPALLEIPPELDLPTRPES